MYAIEIKRLSNGAHRKYWIDNTIDNLEEGWAIVPEDLIWENFPYGDIEVEEINGILTVVSCIPCEPQNQKEVNNITFSADAQIFYTGLMTDTLLVMPDKQLIKAWYSNNLLNLNTINLLLEQNKITNKEYFFILGEKQIKKEI